MTNYSYAYGGAWGFGFTVCACRPYALRVYGVSGFRAFLRLWSLGLGTRHVHLACQRLAAQPPCLVDLHRRVYSWVVHEVLELGSPCG